MGIKVIKSYVPLSVAILTLAILGVMFYSFSLGRSMAERYTPLVDAAMEIKLEAATAHLWFEEVISGDRFTDLSEVWKHLDQSEWYAQAMLDGGENSEGKFVPLRDPVLRQKIEETLSGISGFRAIAEKRWAARSSSGIGSDIDQQFDQKFDDFLSSADEVESALQLAMKNQLREFRSIQTFLFIAVSLFGGTLAMVLQRYYRRQREEAMALSKAQRLYATLSQVNQEIVRENDRSKLFQRICDIAIEFGHFRMAWIGLIDLDGLHIKPVSFSGTGTKFLPDPDRFFRDDFTLKGPNGRALLKASSIVFNGFEHDPDFQSWCADVLEQGSGSSATFPISCNNQIVGALSLYSSEAGFFDESELRLLNETAGDISYALGRLEQQEAHDQMELAVQESEAKYRALYENAPLSYQSLNEEGYINDVNPAWLLTLGYEREEVIGRWFGEFLGPDWTAHFKKNFPEFKRAGYIKDVQFKMRHKKGHYLDVAFEGCIGYKPDGSFMQTYCVFKDITEQKRIAAKAHEQEQVIASVFEVLPDLFFLMDKDGTIREYRARQSSDLYIQPEVFIGSNYSPPCGILPANAI